MRTSQTMVHGLGMLWNSLEIIGLMVMVRVGEGISQDRIGERERIKISGKVDIEICDSKVGP